MNYKHRQEKQMCDMCYGYIYDTLVSPLSADHLLIKHIHRPSLLRCSTKLANCFHKALEGFDNHPEFFVNMDPDDYMKFKSQNDPRMREFMEDNWTWDKFYKNYPMASENLTQCKEICMDSSITRHTFAHEHVIKNFLMDRLRIFLSQIPIIHKNHTEKSSYQNVQSPGPVPIKKIIEIRSKLGLPVSYLEKEPSFSITIRGDLELYY